MSVELRVARAAAAVRVFCLARQPKVVVEFSTRQLSRCVTLRLVSSRFVECLANPIEADVDEIEAAAAAVVLLLLKKVSQLIKSLPVERTIRTNTTNERTKRSLVSMASQAKRCATFFLLSSRLVASLGFNLNIAAKMSPKKLN